MLNDRVKVKTVIEIFRVWLYHLLLKAFFFLKFSSFANNFEKHQTWLIGLIFVQYFKKILMKSLVDLQKDFFSFVHIYYTNEIDSKIHSLLKRAWISHFP